MEGQIIGRDFGSVRLLDSKIMRGGVEHNNNKTLVSWLVACGDAIVILPTELSAKLSSYRCSL